MTIDEEMLCNLLIKRGCAHCREKRIRKNRVKVIDKVRQDQIGLKIRARCERCKTPIEVFVATQGQPAPNGDTALKFLLMRQIARNRSP